MVRRGGLLLVLLAVLAGAGIPRGWMPQASATGLTLSLCSAGLDGAARQEALAAAHRLLAQALDGDDHADSDDGGGDICAFAALPSAALLPDPPSVLADPAPAGRPTTPLAQPAAIGRGLAAPPPPATGPPTHH